MVDRLNDAKTHVIHSMLDGSPTDEGAACAMWALTEIEHVLGTLRSELQGNDDDAPASPTEISALAGALSRSKGASQ
jgi:hypothetical protein